MGMVGMVDAATWTRRCFEGFDQPVRIEHGAFHEVVVAGDRVARILLGADCARRTEREQSIHRVLPDGPGVRMPRLLCDPVEFDGRCGYVVSRVPGVVRTVEWDQAKEPLLAVLDVLHQLAPSGAGLPPERAWCGGRDLAGIVTTCFAEQLGPAHAEAVRLVDDLQQMDTVEGVFVHGDFGPHNVLWEGERICGVVDFDHATIGDPAIDIAPLIGFYGAKAVGQITNKVTLDRAMRHRATLSLQVAAAAHLCQRPDLRNHALSNFRRRWGEGTLFDPRRNTTPMTGLLERSFSQSLGKGVHAGEHVVGV